LSLSDKRVSSLLPDNFIKVTHNNGQELLVVNFLVTLKSILGILNAAKE
jgi:hypothetical protein